MWAGLRLTLKLSLGSIVVMILAIIHFYAIFTLIIFLIPSSICIVIIFLFLFCILFDIHSHDGAVY